MAEQTLRTRLGRGWMGIVARFGHVQTLVMLGFFYAFLIGPASLIASGLRKDLLAKRPVPDAISAWQESESSAPSLERAKLQA